MAVINYFQVIPLIGIKWAIGWRDFILDQGGM